MTPKTVRGTRVWKVGPEIGEGGFGSVHAVIPAEEATSAGFVVKLVPKAPGADREILFQAVEGTRNVVPIVDTGEVDSWYFLVMPRADYSLYDRIEAEGKLSVQDTLTVIYDVANALQSLLGKIVHRDLKPGNILWLNGSWCLSDFGISRYAEASTAAETRKFSFTPAYAAPEQWRHEHADQAADIYALGVCAFQMLSGRLPFPGPRAADFREQHLHTIAPRLDHGPTALRTLIAQCLLKAREARPLVSEILRAVTNSSANNQP